MDSVPPSPPSRAARWKRFLAGLALPWAAAVLLFLVLGGMFSVHVLAGIFWGVLLLGLYVGVRRRSWALLAGTGTGFALVVLVALARHGW